MIYKPSDRFLVALLALLLQGHVLVQGTFAEDSTEKSAGSNESAPERELVSTQKGNKAVKKSSEPVTVDARQLAPKTIEALSQLSEAVHEEDRGIYNELRDDEELSLKDIGMLWQAAVERSGTIRYAIEKLSRRDATGKPVNGDSMTKRIVQSLTRVGGVAGSMWTGTPAGMLGGNMINDLIQGDPSDPAMNRVSDADMLILAKEVESLQSRLIEAYYTYRNSKERWDLTKEANRTMEKYNKRALRTQAVTPEAQALQASVEAFAQGGQQEEESAKQAFISARNSLGLLVGEEALVALENAQQVGQVSN